MGFQVSSWGSSVVVSSGDKIWMVHGELLSPDTERGGIDVGCGE